MKYERIAEAVISAAVRKHLQDELKTHCQRVAKAKATAWLSKNKKAIETAIEAAVEKRFNTELSAVVKKAAAAVSVKAPVARRW